MKLVVAEKHGRSLQDQDPAGKGTEDRRPPGIRQGEAGCSRKGHCVEAHTGKDPEGKVQVEERPGAVSQRGGESCLGT